LNLVASLNYSLSLLRAALSDAGQVTILTHNLQFMNEAKKWLKPLARANPPTAALYYQNAPLEIDARRYEAVT
jgi:hypothetical protein